ALAPHRGLGARARRRRTRPLGRRPRADAAARESARLPRARRARRSRPARGGALRSRTAHRRCGADGRRRPPPPRAAIADRLRARAPAAACGAPAQRHRAAREPRMGAMGRDRAPSRARGPRGHRARRRATRGRGRARGGGLPAGRRRRAASRRRRAGPSRAVAARAHRAPRGRRRRRPREPAANPERARRRARHRRPRGARRRRGPIAAAARRSGAGRDRGRRARARRARRGSREPGPRRPGGRLCTRVASLRRRRARGRDAGGPRLPRRPRPARAPSHRLPLSPGLARARLRRVRARGSGGRAARVARRAKVPSAMIADEIETGGRGAGSASAPRRSPAAWMAAGLACLAAYGAACAWLTWPLAARIATHLPDSTPACRFDTLFTVWLLAYESHRLATAPLALAQATIYAPTANALFYGPTCAAALPWFAPTYWATGNPTLALNVPFLAGAALTATALHLVVRHWTGSHAAGAVAGTVLLTDRWLLWEFPPTAPIYALLFGFPVLFLLLARPTASWRRTLLAIPVVIGQALVHFGYVAPSVLGPLAALAAVRIARPRTRRAGLQVALVVGL